MNAVDLDELDSEEFEIVSSLFDERSSEYGIETYIYALVRNFMSIDYKNILQIYIGGMRSFFLRKPLTVNFSTIFNVRPTASDESMITLIMSTVETYKPIITNMFSSVKYATPKIEKHFRILTKDFDLMTIVTGETIDVYQLNKKIHTIPGLEMRNADLIEIQSILLEK